MKKIILIILVLLTCTYAVQGAGSLESVYLNPTAVGNDANSGSVPMYPVKTWDKALSLAANNATIYITGSYVPITTSVTINGSQYGATGIKVTQYTGYTGSLFAIADGGTASFSNITLEPSSTSKILIQANSGASITIGSGVGMTNDGEISMDAGANALNLTSTPLPGTKFAIRTKYELATDEGRIIVNSSIGSPLQYFTLVEPMTTANIVYNLDLDGSDIRLYELPVGGIYWDNINGSDSYSGAKSNHAVKTYDKAVELWNDRNVVAGTVTDIYVVNPIVLTENTVYNDGVTLTRFAGDSDRPAACNSYLITFTNYNLTLDDVTINNGNSGNYALYSNCNNIGTRSLLTINDGATLTTNSSSLIFLAYDTANINGGKFVENVSTISYGQLLEIRSGSVVTINGGIIDAKNCGAILAESSTLIINKAKISSSNTTNGAIYTWLLELNGEDAEVDGIIYLSHKSLDKKYITINSNTVTQNYKIKVLEGVPYTAVVRSNPSVDLGPYIGKFTLVPMVGYELTAYASNNGTNRDIVLYNPDAIYVNGVSGNDSNTGNTPVAAVKTLPVATSKTTATKRKIFICDSTFVISNAVTVSPSQIDTIYPYNFTPNAISMIEVVDGGSLTMSNVVVGNYYMSIYRLMLVTGGDLVLNNNSTVLCQYANSNLIGISVMSGDLTMNSGSLLTSSTTYTPTSGIRSIVGTAYGLDINKSPLTVTNVTLNNGSSVKYFGGNGVSLNGGTLNINGGIIDSCSIMTNSNGFRIIDGIVNMTSGKIINNGSFSSTYYYDGMGVNMYGGTFNFNGGEISGNKGYTYGLGEQVYLTGTAVFNFNGGKIAATSPEKNAIYVSSSSASNGARLVLCNSSVIDSGYINCNVPYKAPISLSESLNATSVFDINLGDNMAGATLVDGTNPGTTPASVSNFLLNPTVTSLSLAQIGNDVVVSSTAVYINGQMGNDEYDGSTSALAVKTFARARERLQATGGNLIIVLGTIYVNDIQSWNLSFNTNAIMQRGGGFFGRMVELSGENASLTLSDITIDGNKDVVTQTGESIVSVANGGKLIINSGTVLQNNKIYQNTLVGAAVTVFNGSVVMNDGIITGNESNNSNNYGTIYYYETTASYRYNNAFTMTGGKIVQNKLSGICIGTYETKNQSVDISITGGEISENHSGIYIIHNLKPSVIGGTVKINNNANSGLYAKDCVQTTINGGEISGNYYGVYVYNNVSHQGNIDITGGDISFNNSYGIYIDGYGTLNISGNTQVRNNNCGIYCGTYLPTTISGNVQIKGNNSTHYVGGGLQLLNGTMKISDNVIFDSDTCIYYGGGINVAESGTLEISGSVQIKNCVNHTTSYNSGGGGVSVSGIFSMTGGDIIGNKSEKRGGGIFVAKPNSNVLLSGVNISDNTAESGGAISLYTGTLTLDENTVTGNTTTLQTLENPQTGAIEYIDGALYLRDKGLYDDLFYLASGKIIFADEALLSATTGSYKLLSNITTPGTKVVGPNGTTITDASQYLPVFTLANVNLGRGLDKDDVYIIIVNQYFIDSSKPNGGNGSNPAVAFNEVADLNAIFDVDYTSVYVSGEVVITGNEQFPAVTHKNVKVHRYTGFVVAAQPYPIYKGTMFTINNGATLTIPGGNTEANTMLVDGLDSAMISTDASIFKNNGTLNINGYVDILQNKTAGLADAIYQNGTLNIAGTVNINTGGKHTVYLPEGKVINVMSALDPSISPIGVTVETSPQNTQIPARVVATGTTTILPVGSEAMFYNEIMPDPLPLGRVVNGANANIAFYLADRNIAGKPIYMKLQDAIDAAVSANNEEVRLYGNTNETILFNKIMKYQSNGHTVFGAATLDSVSNIQLTDTMKVDTLVIRATTFSQKAILDVNGYDVKAYKAAYLDLQLPYGAKSGDWYPINLPFEALVADMRNAADTTYRLVNMSTFALAEYNGSYRSIYGIGNQPTNPHNDWQYFSGSKLINGSPYMISTAGLRSIRFKAENLNLFKTTTAPLVYYIGAAGSAHYGINYVAQPLSTNATISSGIPTGAIIQVSESLSSDKIGGASYVAKTVNASTVIAPYTNYYYQTSANNTVGYTKSTSVATVRSSILSKGEIIASEVPSYFELRLFGYDNNQYDALFVAASEMASKSDYEIGRDVVKMGMNRAVTQLWSRDFDVSLCANEATLEKGVAYIPLYMNLPEKGLEYHLKLVEKANDREALWLCYKGNRIQNLSENPDFIIEGTGETTDEYSIVILSGATGSTAVFDTNIYVYSELGNIIINGMNSGDKYEIFDMSGRIVVNGFANATKVVIPMEKGFYIVKVNGVTYKTYVK